MGWAGLSPVSHLLVFSEVVASGFGVLALSEGGLGSWRTLLAEADEVGNKSRVGVRVDTQSHSSTSSIKSSTTNSNSGVVGESGEAGTSSIILFCSSGFTILSLFAMSPFTGA